MKTALVALALLISSVTLAHADPEDAESFFGGCGPSESEMGPGCGMNSGGEPTISCEVGGGRRGSSLPTIGIFAFVGLRLARKRNRAR